MFILRCCNTKKYKNLVKLESSEKINAAILLYNFQYDGRVNSVNNNVYEFKFVGTVEYIAY